MNITGDITGTERAGKRVSRYEPARWVLTAVREAYGNPEAFQCLGPDAAAQYWREQIETDPTVSMETEVGVVLMLNTRKRVIGHVVLATGTLDTLLIHPREVFRPAIIAGAQIIVMIHHHPSGDPSPSEADIKVTRDIMRAGQLLKIELMDHVIVGAPPRYASLREMGYLAV